MVSSKSQSHHHNGEPQGAPSKKKRQKQDGVDDNDDDDGEYVQGNHLSLVQVMWHGCLSWEVLWQQLHWSCHNWAKWARQSLSCSPSLCSLDSLCTSAKLAKWVRHSLSYSLFLCSPCSLCTSAKSAKWARCSLSHSLSLCSLCNHCTSAKCACCSLSLCSSHCHCISARCAVCSHSSSAYLSCHPITSWDSMITPQVWSGSTWWWFCNHQLCLAWNPCSSLCCQSTLSWIGAEGPAIGMSEGPAIGADGPATGMCEGPAIGVEGPVTDMEGPAAPGKLSFGSGHHLPQFCNWRACWDWKPCSNLCC